jgi:type IV secretion system protein VirB4
MVSIASKRAPSLQMELSASARIPYSAHVSPTVVRTTAGDYVQAFRVTGASYECADDVTINLWHERLNIAYRSIASPNVAIWTHLVRRRAQAYPSGDFAAAFARRLNDRYRQRIDGEQLMVNELYFSIVYRPTSNTATQVTTRMLSKLQPQGAALELKDSLDVCEKLSQVLAAALDLYEPEQLSTYREGAQLRSQLLDYFGLLINGESQHLPLPRGPLNTALATTRPLFGVEALEYRTPTHTRLGAFLGILEYATPTSPAVLSALLKAPFPLVLTQSISFVSQPTGQGLLQRQYRRLTNSGDFAQTQAEELKEALDAYAGGEFALGSHHLSLQVLTDPYAGVVTTDQEQRVRELNERIAIARPLLTDAGLLVAREDLALEAAFWAQLPGNFSRRPRTAVITTRNFAGMAPLHGHPTGRLRGNHWGDALALFPSAARSPYYFSLHASDWREADGGTRKDLGHTFICGPTGSGKTVLIGFLVAMLMKHGATQVVIDKDHGLEILVRALDGEYLALRSGVATGFNPLQLPTTPVHLEFLRQWLVLLARPASVREETDLFQALRGTLSLAPEARRLSRLIEFVDSTDPAGLYPRLARWTYAARGEYAWVFDNSTDSVVPRLGAQTILGFDVTDVLSNPAICTPVSWYLFNLIDALVDGRRLVCWMDEFSNLLGDPVFESRARNALKTWRKLEGVLCVSTQSPHDALQSPIARSIIEGTATKIFLPNSDAAAEDYMDGFGLTEREFQLIKERIDPSSRQFLIKQGRYSTVCELNLKGFDAELAVISGRASSVQMMHAAMEIAGQQSEEWLPTFLRLLGESKRVEGEGHAS